MRRTILRWASTLERPLPWRCERDPWRILCSEVMLQQTQAGRVADVFDAFLELFPTAEAMAAAQPADVLRAWGNLGYPRRALNLWRASKMIAAEGWPKGVDALTLLPGIGPYTARAVASFAFNADVAAVDANVKRVIRRWYGAGVDEQMAADALVPAAKAAVWNQAMIDFGAVVCTARAPRCDRCPMLSRCPWDGDPVRKKVTRPRFEDTARYARGRVVEALRNNRTVSRATLRRITALAPARIDDAVETLCRDGLAHLGARGAISLGPASAVRR